MSKKEGAIIYECALGSANAHHIGIIGSDGNR